MPAVALTRDQFDNLVQDSYGEKAFRGEYDVGNNLIYAGLALPGSDTGDLVWQIRKLTYSTNNLISVQWPELDGKASKTYSFEWDERATYTYS